MRKQKECSRYAGKWVTKAYRYLAAGRYVMSWLSEFLILYDMIVSEEGENAARDWAFRELLLSIKPSLTIRAYRLLRIIYLTWKAYRKVASE